MEAYGTQPAPAAREPLATRSPSELTFWNVTAVTGALEDIRTCRPDVLAYFKQLVDEYSGIARSIAYYDMVAGDWLEHFMHLTTAAWRRVTERSEQGTPGEVPVMATPGAFAERVTESPEVRDRIAWMIRALGAPHQEWTWRAQAPGTGRLNSSSRWSKRLLDLASPGAAPVLISAPYYRCTRLQWLAAMQRLRRIARCDDLQYPVQVPGRIDSAWRVDRAARAGRVDSLRQAFRALLPLVAPTAFLEDFGTLHAQVTALPVPRPRAVYTAQMYRLTFKVLAAEWRELGTQVLVHQHGGGYGIDRVKALEEYERRVSDRFYTWGWTVLGDEKVVPMSSPPPPIHRRPRSRRILLCCVNFPQLEYWIHLQPMPLGSIERMHDDTLRFVEATVGRYELAVRPYSADYGWGFVDRLRQAAPQAMKDTSGDQFRQYARSAVVVHNYLGTGWLETLALDVPTLCFYDPETYAFRDDAVPFIAALERVGVIHRSADSAAAFLDETQDLEGWWRHADVQDARVAFCARYANFSRDWVAQWAREFEREADARR